MTFPPDGILIPYDRKNRYANVLKPTVQYNANSLDEEQLATAQRTYAVIISGGINKNANHERYWNDCSFIYQTLTKKYFVPKNHIYAIMADGDNPDIDMRRGDGFYASSQLDLDFDGQPELHLAATKPNVYNIFK